MRFQTLAAVVLPALVLGAPTPQDPDYTFPEDQPDDSIVGGTAASAGEFPFIASLHVGGGHYCGGSIINSDTIVTAAHCSVPSEIGPVSGLRVRLGSLSKSSGGTFVGVSRVISHPNYRTNSQDYDVAIWKLSTPVSAGGNIAYASLPSAGSDPSAGTSLTVAGWGALRESGGSPNALQKVSVPVVSRTECRASYGSTITNNMFCAGFAAGGKDSCQGDSGGPIVNSAKTLLGLVSFGYGCAQPNFPGVYASVSSLLPFINQYS
ncbi:trypsin precursor [Stemphylium lycopersici]|uniref:Trypsin n=1 Tax=Stemphylium lycopersici TaxID=183478 RepID=A0A364MVA8_STELY|nr:trypsin [Stemphylium lycopersici]RAR00846.1 trypsin precursor [Stemphylium lycopersici]RAR04605.1 trypsin precursor [Stemphylium lycopersici]